MQSGQAAHPQLDRPLLYVHPDLQPHLLHQRPVYLLPVLPDWRVAVRRDQHFTRLRFALRQKEPRSARTGGGRAGACRCCCCGDETVAHLELLGGQCLEHNLLSAPGTGVRL